MLYSPITSRSRDDPASGPPVARGHRRAGDDVRAYPSAEVIATSYERKNVLVTGAAVFIGLGFGPAVGLKEGLGHLVAWHRQRFSPPW